MANFKYSVCMCCPRSLLSFEILTDSPCRDTHVHLFGKLHSSNHAAFLARTVLSVEHSTIYTLSATLAVHSARTIVYTGWLNATCDIVSGSCVDC